jgi:hypothetical protein
MKISPVCLMRSSTFRFASPRIELVANTPARFARPAAISSRAFSKK